VPGSSKAPIVIPTKTPVSTASLAMGGLALVAAGGLYYYAKKKGMV
jgi:LPXTG-motif cell wall-anchored protein